VVGCDQQLSLPKYRKRLVLLVLNLPQLGFRQMRAQMQKREAVFLTPASAPEREPEGPKPPERLPKIVGAAWTN
jgi:hypothetical protein